MNGHRWPATRLAGLALVVCAPMVSGQAIDRSKQPVAPPPLPFKFPAVESRTLPNGITVRIVENHALPLVAVRGFVEGGSLLDPRGKEGLFTLDTLLLRDGTASRSGEQLGDAVAEVGSPFDSFDPTRRFSPFRFTSVSGEFEQSLAIMGDMLMHPSFPAPSLDRRKTQLSSNLQRAEGVASTVALRIFNRTLWGADHPFALAASAATMSTITRDDVVQFHDKYVRPQNLTLTIVGDVSPAAAMAAVTKVFGGWQRNGDRVAVTVPAPAPPSATTIYLFDRPNSPQSTLFVGQTSAPRAAPDFYALEAMGALFGGPTGSRLTMALREQRALTYGIVHLPLWRRANDPASIHGSSNVDATKTDSAVAAWFSELKGLGGARPITDAELAFARAATAGGLATRIETIDEVANRLNIVARDALPTTYYDDYFRGINRVTVAEVAQAATRTINPARTVIVVVGDRKLVEGPLRALGVAPVVIVDAEGRVIP